MTLNLSTVKKTKSTPTIKEERVEDLEIKGDYTFKFDKENFFRPLTILEEAPIIGNFFSEYRIYYTPEKISTSITLNEHDQLSIQRVGTITPTYTFNMSRKFQLNYRFTKNFKSNYSVNIASNLDKYQNNKFGFLKEFDSGEINSIDEKLTNTFSPDYLRWLKPTISYNPSFSRDFDYSKDEPLVDMKTNSSLKSSINFSPKDFISLFYSSGNSSSSSKRSRSRSSSSRSNSKIYEFTNPTIKSVLGYIYDYSSKITKISANYDLTASHTHSNLLGTVDPGLLFKIGLKDRPENIDFSNGSTYTYSHKYTRSSKINSGLNLMKNFLVTLDYKNSNTLNQQSSGSPTENQSSSFFPLGPRGDSGIPFANWNINWTGIEKIKLYNDFSLDKFFKTVSISHNFRGDVSRSFRDNSSIPENENYTRSFSPLCSFTLKTKQRTNPIVYKLNFGNTKNIKNTGNSTEITYTDNISTSISMQNKNGFTIPLFFFRDFYIENDVTFNFNVNFDQSKTLISSFIVGSEEDFNEQASSSNIMIKPDITYKFSRWVNGTIFYSYGISENKTTGKKKEQDFGFVINIKITG